MRKTGFAALAVFLIATNAWAQRMDQMPGAMAPAAPLAANLQEGVAAVVNESVITTGDVRDRIGLVLLSAGFPNTPETRARVLPQVMRSLIDEQLQLQEGKKDDISISEDEITSAMNKIAQENKIPGGDMAAFLSAQGVAPSSLRQQVRAGMTWTRVVMRQIRPRIDIGDDEIAAEAEKARANAGRQEYLVSEIFLPVDKPEEDEQVRSFAADLAQKLKEGAVFGALARQFSQSSSAGAGGDIGWILSGMLDGEVDTLLQSLEAGQIGGPVRSAGGYYLLGLREKRTVAMGDLKEMKLHLGQLFRPYSARADKNTVLREGEKLRGVITSCSDASERLKPDFAAWRWQDLGTMQLDQAPKWLVDQTLNLAVGETSAPMATERGALVLLVCEREMPDTIDRDALRTLIGTEKMDLLARRFMRDLRAAAYIDLRGKDVP